MTQPVTFRSAMPEDTQWIYNSLQETAIIHHISDRFIMTPQQFEEKLFSKNPAAEVLLACSNLQPVGFSFFSVTNRNFTLFPSPGFYIHNLYVVPECRRKKIATQLMQQLKMKAQAKGYCRIDWVVLKNNLSADLFFASLKEAKDVDYIRYQRLSL